MNFPLISTLKLRINTFGTISTASVPLHPSAVSSQPTSATSVNAGSFGPTRAQWYTNFARTFSTLTRPKRIASSASMFCVSSNPHGYCNVANDLR